MAVPKIKILLTAKKAQRVVNFSSFLVFIVNREKKKKKKKNKSVFHMSGLANILFRNKENCKMKNKIKLQTEIVPTEL